MLKNVCFFAFLFFSNRFIFSSCCCCCCFFKYEFLDLNVAYKAALSGSFELSTTRVVVTLARFIVSVGVGVVCACAECCFEWRQGGQVAEHRCQATSTALPRVEARHARERADSVGVCACAPRQDGRTRAGRVQIDFGSSMWQFWTRHPTRRWEVFFVLVFVFGCCFTSTVVGDFVQYDDDVNRWLMNRAPVPDDVNGKVSEVLLLFWRRFRVWREL